MELNILYATDENYAMYTGISLYSLLENNTNIEHIKIHILDNGILNDSRLKLNILAETFNREIKYWDAKKLFVELESKITMKNTQTITAYACYFMAYILNETVDKILYMDGDTLVLGDLSELCKIDMSDTYVCGALDIAALIVREKIGFNQNEPYINSGFLYMSLNNIRKANLRPNIIKFIEEVIPTSMHNDKGVVNGVYKNHIKVLPLKYNVLTPLYEKTYDQIREYYNIEDNYYSDTEVQNAINNPVFVHFTASFTKRPWVKGCKHPLKGKWDEYKQKTEWKGKEDKPDSRSCKRQLIDFLFNILDVRQFQFLYRLLGNKK